MFGEHFIDDFGTSSAKGIILMYNDARRPIESLKEIDNGQSGRAVGRNCSIEGRMRMSIGEIHVRSGMGNDWNANVLTESSDRVSLSGEFRTNNTDDVRCGDGEARTSQSIDHVTGSGCCRPAYRLSIDGKLGLLGEYYCCLEHGT